MSIITLTTDFGLQDYYVGALKGALLSKLPELQIIDISHQIRAFDLLHAAYVIRHAYHLYPKGTIHFLGITNPTDQSESLLLAKLNDQWILTPDNGILSLIGKEKVGDVYVVGKFSTDWKNSYQNLASVLQTILPLPPGPNSVLTQDYLKSLHLQPIQGQHDIQGIIMHIDNYGNLVSNIHSMLFEQIGQGRPFEIQLKPRLRVNKISTSLQGVAAGDNFVVVNAAGLLSFGVCMGNAAALHSLEKGANIQIQFSA